MRPSGPPSPGGLQSSFRGGWVDNYSDTGEGHWSEGVGPVMRAWMQNERRDTVAATRKRPAVPHQATFAADGDGKLGAQEDPRPTELLVEATDPTGQIADWLDDVWWMELLGRWKGRPLAIHILPSNAALLHPVVLHQVSMVKRVARGWRMVAHGYCCDVSGDPAVEALATSAYDEVRLVEGVRPNDDSRPSPAHVLRIEDLFSRVRRIQQSRGATRPVLMRAISIPAVPGEESMSRPGHPQGVSQESG